MKEDHIKYTNHLISIYTYHPIKWGLPFDPNRHEWVNFAIADRPVPFVVAAVVVVRDDVVVVNASWVAAVVAAVVAWTFVVAVLASPWIVVVVVAD